MSHDLKIRGNSVPPIPAGRAALGLSAAAVGILACTLPAGATENGATQWPLGVQTVAPAVLPPPGATSFYNYTVYYHADRFNDSQGHASVPGFELNVLADGARIVHTWESQLGGWNVSSGVTLAGNYIHLETTTPLGRRSDSTFGLNFLHVIPLYLTKQIGDLHFLFGPGVFIPVGPFDQKDLVNPTNNYFSFNQELAVTYMPSPRLEVSAELAITVNDENPDTHYHSGATYDIDFGINFAPFESMPNVFLGLNGFYAKQFEDDEINGVKVRDGFRLEKAALGAQAIYYFSKSAGIAAKWQHEFEAENTPQGDRYWVQFVVPVAR
jgi:hypothetical protein